MRRYDPYHDRKDYHFASLINSRGEVSALCFARPRPINLKVAMWTNRLEAVTCRKCLTILADWPMEIAESKAHEIQARYYELLYAVGNKHQGESRHDTALRYIRKAEELSGNVASVCGVPVKGKGRVRVGAVT